MKGVKPITLDLISKLKKPYVAVKTSEKKLTLKIFDACGSIITQEFKNKEGLWYGYSKWNNWTGATNEKKEELEFEDFIYIADNTILKYQMTKNLYNVKKTYPVIVLIETPDKQFEFLSDKKEPNHKYDIEKLKINSFAVVGNYSVSKIRIENDILTREITTYFDDNSIDTWISINKLNNIPSFFFNKYNCNNGISHISYKKLIR